MLLINLPRILDPRGNLTVAQAQEQVPFDIRRVYWVYDVPAGESRGGHAHKRCRELIVAVSGSFHVSTTEQNGKPPCSITPTKDCSWRQTPGAPSTTSPPEP